MGLVGWVGLVGRGTDPLIVSNVKRGLVANTFFVLV